MVHYETYGVDPVEPCSEPLPSVAIVGKPTISTGDELIIPVHLLIRDDVELMHPSHIPIEDLSNVPFVVVPRGIVWRDASLPGLD